MDTDKLWKQALAEIQLSVSPAIYKTAFSLASLQSYENGVATLAIPNSMVRDMIENRYYSLVKNVLDHHTKENTSILFVLVQKKQVMTREEIGPLFADRQLSNIDSVAVARKLHIRPDASFENFAVSPSNQLAYAAATAVEKSPGTAYNPLFLYGGVGVGKTHLMHAVANGLLKRKQNLRVVYAMGEEFLNEIVSAIQKKTAIEFKKKYRNADLLLIDDVQFIAGKQTAQEEFFHTFNAVHREGGQIILTSDRPPSDIAKLEDRLRSRFEGGLTVDVAPPDFELRVAIINIKAEQLSIVVPSSEAQLIATHITDTRAIEGFLRKLMNAVTINKAPVTESLVKNLLNITDKQLASFKNNDQVDTVPKKRNDRITPLDVLEAVCDYYEIKPMHLKGPKRDRPIARPRQLVMYICKQDLQVTLDDIGGLLGGRDHTTILHGVDKMKEELSTNTDLQKALVHIRSSLSL